MVLLSSLDSCASNCSSTLLPQKLLLQLLEWPKSRSLVQELYLFLATRRSKCWTKQTLATCLHSAVVCVILDSIWLSDLPVWYRSNIFWLLLFNQFGLGSRPSMVVTLGSNDYQYSGIQLSLCKFDNMPPNQSMQRKLDPGLRLATPSLSPASSSADLKR